MSDIKGKEMKPISAEKYHDLCYEMECPAAVVDDGGAYCVKEDGCIFEEED